MPTIAYDAVVRWDAERGVGYMAIATARSIGTLTIADWDWTGYGDTPQEAIAALESRLQELHEMACQPCRIVYEMREKGSCS